MARSSYTIDIIRECCSKFRNGEAVCDIIKETGVPRSTIYYWIKQYKGLDDLNDITLKKTLDNLQRKYKKSQQICEVLKSVNCTPNSPLKTKLYELEKLYGKYSVHVLCEALDVNRGTFYNHVLRNKKQNSSYVQRRTELSEAISKIYEESHGLFGSDKILSVLHSQGYHTSKKMVRGLMKEMGLKSLRSRAKKDYQNWIKLHEHTNILKQNFEAEAPNLIWVSDCTQFVFSHKTYYLCAILDLFSRKVIAYKISSNASTQLVTATFKQAFKDRKPGNQLIFHSDRGCQYNSYSFRKLLMDNHVTQSFSGPRNPYDNGVMEVFFASLKQEEIYRTSYRSFEDCKSHIKEYMNFYNSQRPHRADNYKTPNAVEENYYKKQINSAL
ncbi:MAG: IS3 family transposase [Massiliimalia sp.]|jgi:putative transposase